MISPTIESGSPAPGKTFGSALVRLKDKHGLESLGNLSRRHSGASMRSTASRRSERIDRRRRSRLRELVLTHAAEHDPTIDAGAPGRARATLRKAATDEFAGTQPAHHATPKSALLEWIDANAERTALPLRDLVEFALATGMRRGEILALQWTDINGRVATIKRKHPTERDRAKSVPLLKPKRGSWPRVDPLAIIDRQPRLGPRMFPYLGDTLGFWFEVARKGAEVNGVVFHQLRHECLSRLADRGFDPLRLALVGGHRDLRNVKRYAKLDAERLANE